LIPKAKKVKKYMKTIDNSSMNVIDKSMSKTRKDISTFEIIQNSMLHKTITGSIKANASKSM
jgi:hypothetical protein